MRFAYVNQLRSVRLAPEALAVWLVDTRLSALHNDPRVHRFEVVVLGFVVFGGPPFVWGVGRSVD